MTAREGKTKAPMLLALGLGYTAAALARRLAGQGWAILGTGRTPRAGVIAFAGEASPDLIAAAQAAQAILCSIPPDGAGCPAFRALRPHLSGFPGWIGYLSTTGVYGDLQGRWAFEWTPPNPQSAQAHARALAETQWLTLGAQIFRLPGIYGPGRSAFDRIRAGENRAIIKPGQVFSRAHVEDIAGALALSIAQPNPQRIYNICDDEPAPPQDVTRAAAALLGVAAPTEIPYAEADLSPMAQRFYAESKRVSNARAKAELGWRPQFPTFREGLDAILAAETAR